jgi:hypothetical protein
MTDEDRSRLTHALDTAYALYQKGLAHWRTQHRQTSIATDNISYDPVGTPASIIARAKHYHGELRRLRVENFALKHQSDVLLRRWMKMRSRLWSSSTGHR